MKMDLQRQMTLLSKHDTGYYHLHDNKHANNNNKTNCTTGTIILLLLLLLIVSLMQILKMKEH